MIFILTPILLPIDVKVGVDPIRFGTIMVVYLAIGLVTPPTGVNLFVASSIKIEQLLRTVLQLILLMIGILLLDTHVPSFSLVPTL